MKLEITLFDRDVSTPRKYPSQLSLVRKYSNFDIHFELTLSKMVRFAYFLNKMKFMGILLMYRCKSCNHVAEDIENFELF